MSHYLPQLKYTYPITVRFSGLIGVLLVSLGFLFIQKNMNIAVLEKIPAPDIEVIDAVPPTTIDLPKEPLRPSLPRVSEDPDFAPDITIPETEIPGYVPLTEVSSMPSKGPSSIFVEYDEPPKPLTPIRPKYPEIAQEAGIEGLVVVNVYIDKKGRVKETSIRKGIPNTGLNEAAVEAIRKTRFTPAMQRDMAVGVWISIPVKFRLK